MSRSSTSSSEASWGVRPAAFLPTIAAVALCLGLLELGYRKWQPVDTSSGWDDPTLAAKAETGRQYIAEHGGKLDVLLLSTSITKNVDVSQWEEACGGNIRCWNGAVPGQRPQQARFMLQGHYGPLGHPSHVILAVCPRDVSTNGGLQNAAGRKYGTFFDSYMLRKACAETWFEKLKLMPRTYSLILRERNHLRAWLTQGLNKKYNQLPLFDAGVTAGSIMRVPEMPSGPPWIKAFPGMNPFAKFQMPPDGELGEIIALGKYCRDNKIEFAVVNYPLPPYADSAFDDAGKDWAAYYAGLDAVRKSGIEVLDAKKDLGLSNAFFEDFSHDNRWGAQAACNYLYQRLIRKWFPKVAKLDKLDDPHQVRVAELPVIAGESAIKRTIIAPYSPVETQYEAPTQAVMEAPARLRVADSLPAGEYVVEVYGGNLAKPELPAPGGTVQLHIALAAGADGEVVPLPRWERTLQKMGYARVRVRVPEKAAIDLEATQGTSILDTVFYRRVNGS